MVIAHRDFLRFQSERMGGLSSAKENLSKKQNPWKYKENMKPHHGPRPP
jgi:hypothetical protein